MGVAVGEAWEGWTRDNQGQVRGQEGFGLDDTSIISFTLMFSQASLISKLIELYPSNTSSLLYDLNEAGHKGGVRVWGYAYDPRAWGVETGGSEIQAQFQLTQVLGQVGLTDSVSNKTKTRN